jgi:hypothetical protein
VKLAGSRTLVSLVLVLVVVAVVDVEALELDAVLTTTACWDELVWVTAAAAELEWLEPPHAVSASAANGSARGRTVWRRRTLMGAEHRRTLIRCRSS